MTFYQRLEPLMLEKGLDEKDIAAIAGVKPASVSGWKIEGSMPKANTAVKIAKKLNTTVEYLVTGEDKSGLSQIEHDLLAGFQQLNLETQREVLRYVNWMVHQAKEGADQDVPAANQSSEDQEKGA